jgi:hypothetical protein
MAAGTDDEHVCALGPTHEYSGWIAWLHDSLDVRRHVASQHLAQRLVKRVLGTVGDLSGIRQPSRFG